MKLTLFALSMSVMLASTAQDSTVNKIIEQDIPGSSVKFKMVSIPAGSFMFGSPVADKLKDADESPQHKVSIASFWMGQYEVTYDEFNVFFTDNSIGQNIPTDAVTRPSSPYIDMTLGMGKQGGFPANSMQQYGAIMYCKWLYDKTGIFYRLPSEAEWEYACRAGTSTIYPWGDDAKKLNDYAWYQINSENKYHQVGLKQPNAWGLYDMLGNVGEWVLDQYQPDYFSSIADGSSPVRVPTARNPRTVRGGTFRDPLKDLRPASRTMSDLIWNRRDPQIPKSRWWNADAPFVGFRIIRPVEQPTKQEIETFFKTYLGS